MPFAKASSLYSALPADDSFFLLQVWAVEAGADRTSASETEVSCGCQVSGTKRVRPWVLFCHGSFLLLCYCMSFRSLDKVMPPDQEPGSAQLRQVRVRAPTGLGSLLQSDSSLADSSSAVPQALARDWAWIEHLYETCQIIRYPPARIFNLCANAEFKAETNHTAVVMPAGGDRRDAGRSLAAVQCSRVSIGPQVVIPGQPWPLSLLSDLDL